MRTPLARRIERDAALNDVQLFVPYVDDAAVKTVVEDLKNVEHASPTETGSSRELVTLDRRADAAGIFDKLVDGLTRVRITTTTVTLTWTEVFESAYSLDR